MKLSNIILEETKESFNDFAEGRGKGAGKIADSAKDKGGDSMLTLIIEEYKVMRLGQV